MSEQNLITAVKAVHDRPIVYRWQLHVIDQRADRSVFIAVGAVQRSLPQATGDRRIAAIVTVRLLLQSAVRRFRRGVLHQYRHRMSATVARDPSSDASPIQVDIAPTGAKRTSLVDGGVDSRTAVGHCVKIAGVIDGSPMTVRRDAVQETVKGRRPARRFSQTLVAVGLVRTDVGIATDRQVAAASEVGRMWLMRWIDGVRCPVGGADDVPLQPRPAGLFRRRRRGAVRGRTDVGRALMMVATASHVPTLVSRLRSDAVVT
jgi:hypothetical protein